MDGTVEAVFYQGKVVGYKLVYSDGLLQMMLKGAKPDKFRDRKDPAGTVDLNVGIAIVPAMSSEADWEANAQIVHDNHKMVDITPTEPEPAPSPTGITIGRG
jgi:hypothetical protein